MLAKLASSTSSDGVMVVNLHPAGSRRVWAEGRGDHDERHRGDAPRDPNLHDGMRGGLFDYKGEKIPW